MCAIGAGLIVYNESIEDRLSLIFKMAFMRVVRVNHDSKVNIHCGYFTANIFLYITVFFIHFNIKQILIDFNEKKQLHCTASVSFVCSRTAKPRSVILTSLSHSQFEAVMLRYSV